MRNELSHPGRRGFTLAELLVVIVVLSLLATILTPTINAVLQRVYRADTRQRIEGLTEGANVFRHDTGSFPGQDDYSEHIGDGTTYDYTGSQVLATILFGMREDDVADPYHALDEDDDRLNADGDDMVPKGLYAKYETGMLAGLTPETVFIDREGDERFLTIMDCFPRSHPIAYYMSAPFEGTDQYILSQNIVYTLPKDGVATEQRAAFETFITDPRFPPANNPPQRAVRDDLFLLISPSIDGTWFNDDDVKNWNEG